ncbi:MAG: XRE family transcriptional regulator [Nitrospirae bacterium YQR-1]
MAISVIDEKVRTRIVRILQQRGIKQKELSEMIGVMPQNLNAYMTGKRGFGKRNITRIASALGISEEAIYSDSSAIKSRIKKTKKIPLISWEKAGQWHEALDIFETGYADDWVSFDTEDENAFALTVSDNSMAPEFIQNDKVMVSPSVDTKTGDYVIAMLSDSITLRRVKYLDEAVLLKTINPDYDDSIITGRDRKNLRIIGKIIARLVKY